MVGEVVAISWDATREGCGDGGWTPSKFERAPATLLAKTTEPVSPQARCSPNRGGVTVW
jgi:hypothetical protein